MFKHVFINCSESIDILSKEKHWMMKGG